MITGTQINYSSVAYNLVADIKKVQEVQQKATEFEKSIEENKNIERKETYSNNVAYPTMKYYSEFQADMVLNRSDLLDEYKRRMAYIAYAA